MAAVLQPLNGPRTVRIVEQPLTVLQPVTNRRQLVRAPRVRAITIVAIAPLARELHMQNPQASIQVRMGPRITPTGCDLLVQTVARQTEMVQKPEVQRQMFQRAEVR